MFLRPRVAVLAALFAALTAVGAQIRIPFPLVPLTLQTPFVLAAGLVLGPRGGMWAMGLYLLMGLFGLPVFAGAGGPQVVLLPTFGFLLGFVGAAGAAGWVARWDAPDLSPGHRFRLHLLACLCGTGVLYALGLTGLWANLHWVAGKDVSWTAVLEMGLFPFLLGDGVKILGTSVLVSLSLQRVPGLLSGRAPG
ncbi:BioY protein [Aminomonas paucivorans DSM 12260]|uniref:Biotin transporter n=1 Tax=Aminomonas paucivorans DSM 12260 TaxID=584708 RepID=E3D096_9BACT|nr:biotin transporter BioY [Aminomonas paucivorans]EFQ24769.1 BioY protein [Aminomonas paucivorans DSM 12260]